jgi:hypothetical protein
MVHVESARRGRWVTKRGSTAALCCITLMIQMQDIARLRHAHEARVSIEPIAEEEGGFTRGGLRAQHGYVVRPDNRQHRAEYGKDACAKGPRVERRGSR